MILFILGLIVGLLLGILVLLIMARYQIPIHRNMQKLIAGPLIMGNNTAYIAGLSNEESSFAATLPIEKQVKIT